MYLELPGGTFDLYYVPPGQLIFLEFVTVRSLHGLLSGSVTFR